MNSGHYYSYVKAQNGFWFEMDDESVTNVSEKDRFETKGVPSLLLFTQRSGDDDDEENKHWKRG